MIKLASLLKNRPGWFSIIYTVGLALFLLAGATISGVIFYEVEERTQDYRAGVAEVTASRTSANFQSIFDAQVRSLERIHRRIIEAGAGAEPTWNDSAADFLAYNPAFEWLGIMDVRGQVNWHVQARDLSPEEYNALQAALGLPRLAAEAAASKEIQLGVLPLSGNRPAYLAGALPINQDDKVLVTLVNIGKLTRQILAVQEPIFREYYDVAIYDGETPLYLPGTEAIKDIEPASRSLLSIAGLNWRLLVVHVKPPVLSSWLPWLILAFCLTMVALVALVWTQLRRARHHRRHAESLNAHLRDRDEHISLLLNSVVEGIFGQDVEGKCTFCNASCVRLLGYQDESELIGRNLHELMHHTRPDGSAYPQKECPIYLSADSEAGVHRDDELFWRADGTSFAAEYWAHPIRKQDRNIGAVVTFMDITQKRQTLQALRNSQERLELAFKGTTDGVFDWDDSAHSLWCSDRFYELLGYQPGEFPATFESLRSLIHPDDFARTMEAHAGHRKLGLVYDIEHRLRTKSGAYRWFRTRGTSLRYENGRPRRTAGSIEDITERREMITRLAESNAALTRQARELERKNQEVEAFVYIVSHDLRAPLVNLQGFCRELRLSCDDLEHVLEEAALPPETLQRVRGLLHDDLASSLKFISASTEKFERLITALLRLSRTGRQDYRLTKLDIRAIASTTFDSVRQQLDSKQINAVLEDLPPAYGDATAIGQVISNVVDNAIKYAKPDEPGEIRISGSQDNGMCHYVIHDSGLGIPAHAREKLFQVFQRFHPAVAQGEGMGLVIVKRIIERHGGDTWLESEEGGGTAFHFTLCGEEDTAKERFYNER